MQQVSQGKKESILAECIHSSRTWHAQRSACISRVYIVAAALPKAAA